MDSIYKDLAIDGDLLAKIHQIDESISERKKFRFTVRRDPLRQDLIIQTRMDLLAEWELMVRNMIRLTSIVDMQDGTVVAVIEHGGKRNVVKVGESVSNRRITRIDVPNRRVYFNDGNREGYMVEQGIPPKPAELRGMSRAAIADNR
jgi:type II secretory pathway component PulC